MTVSLHGRRLGLNLRGQLVAKGVEITPQCVNCTITVGAEGASVANQRAITIQLLDANGKDINYSAIVRLYVFADAAGLALSAGGTTGIAIGTDGAIFQTIEAKKQFVANSEVDGDIDLTYTDTGTTVSYLGVELPNGRVVISAALTNA